MRRTSVDSTNPTANPHQLRCNAEHVFQSDQVCSAVFCTDLLLLQHLQLVLHGGRQLWKQKRDLHPHRPVRDILRVRSISVKLCRDIDRLESQTKDTADALAYGHCPYIPVGSFPVRRYDRCKRQIPTLFQVVVHEVLQGYLVASENWNLIVRGSCDRTAT